MVKIGMMIGERYEILEKIGTGGMSDVYKAKCHKLNRFVAVKVLKQEFSENGNFVGKFRVEAQAAAGLMHPNIVNVYDVGEENEIYYIVMELVEGITLKKYIEKKARLSYKEAISIAIQISLGIQAAHNNHIIHRDIKPQNIIISKDGKVKVTDFGIAKAASSNTITSNVMGSVHYTSPEQARGGYSDEKSDVYSLGITLFEMLTGRVPFNGETTVAIAIKHIQEEITSPKEYITEIPDSADLIVLKCCQKAPLRRYQSMEELIEDLKQALITPDESFVVFDDDDAEAETRNITDDEMSQIAQETQSNDYADYLRLNKDEYDEENGDEYDEDNNPKMEKLTIIMGILVGIVIIIIIFILIGKLFGNFGLFSSDGKSEDEYVEEEKITMIAVTGKMVEVAQKELEDEGFSVKIEYVESIDYEKNIVLSANLAVGTLANQGATVTLTVSAGVEGIEIPDVKGEAYESALSILVKEGFVVSRVENYSASVEKGYVISQSPSAAQRVPEGTTIILQVSIGKQIEQIAVPQIIGLTQEEGIRTLQESGLIVGNITSRNDSIIAAGLICSQSYSRGVFVEENTPVDIEISLGQEATTYRYNGMIEAPSVEEAPNYLTGNRVNLTIVTENGGKILLDTFTTTFPYPVNFTGIDSPTGIITFAYQFTTDSTVIVDPETGEEVIVQGETEDRSFTRKVTFIEE